MKLWVKVLIPGFHLPTLRRSHPPDAVLRSSSSAVERYASVRSSLGRRRDDSRHAEERRDRRGRSQLTPPERHRLTGTIHRHVAVVSLSASSRKHLSRHRVLDRGCRPIPIGHALSWRPVSSGVDLPENTEAWWETKALTNGRR